MALISAVTHWMFTLPLGPLSALTNTLADAQGIISRLQVARSRTEQALQAAQAAIEEREAAMASLRAELTLAAQHEAALAEAARVEAEKAQAEARLRPAPAPPSEPEPVRWWLDYLKAPRSYSAPQGPASASIKPLAPSLMLTAASVALPDHRLGDHSDVSRRAPTRACPQNAQ